MRTVAADPTLVRRLADACDLAGAAEAVVDHLVARGLPMPSVYFAFAGRLRCLAQRGYWQVHDGVPPEVGELGATFRAGEPRIIRDVRLSPDFIAAGQGVIAETGFPVRYQGRVVGVINVELPRPLEDRDVEVLADAAAALERRLDELGGPPEETRWQLLAREAAALARLQTEEEVGRHAVLQIGPLTQMSSAILVLVDGAQLRVAAVEGPLSAALAMLEAGTLEAIASWCDGGASIYTYGAFPGSGFVGAEQVWDAGIEALLCVPLVGRGAQLHGFVLAADGSPRTPTTDDVAVLEVYAAHLASALQVARGYAELRHQASRDVLTGLGHNRALHERLARELAIPAATLLTLLLVDLDGFKRINDNGGHQLGDQVLIEIAEALAHAAPDGAEAYRIGGDEFAIVLRAADEAEARDVGERIRCAAADTEWTTVSIGIALADRERTRAVDDLMSDADLALYEAKRRGRNRVECFRPELREVVVRRAQTSAELAGAAQRGDLRLVYQPIVKLGSGAVVGAEALVRWQHPKRGLIQPAEFISVAEENGHIAAIGTFVLAEATRQAAAWATTWYGGEPRIAVNVSGEQLEPALVDEVRGALADSGLAPEALVLEITESALAEEPSRIEVLGAVRALGVRVAVDDFGTGYSSLSYLRRLPIDIVKIDRSFIAELDDIRTAAVARAIVELARTLGLLCVAEGVETPEQEQALRDLGCEFAQGYLWGVPVGADQIAGCAPQRS